MVSDIQHTSLFVIAKRQSTSFEKKIWFSLRNNYIHHPLEIIFNHSSSKVACIQLTFQIFLNEFGSMNDIHMKHHYGYEIVVEQENDRTASYH